MNNAMYTTTFYSYKGGVGRTLALMNVAHVLAERGKRVFLLDFDFEAPGIDAYIDARIQDGEPKKGLLEYIEIYLKEHSVAKLTDYVEEVPSLCSHPHPIYAMRCGKKDDAYQTFLSKFDWKSFYKNKKGFFFIENLRSQISAEYSPDYLLIDSRTGLTDISGISTIQLPNMVILLFNLNEQNLHGTSKVFNYIRTNAFNRSIETCLAASPIPDSPEDARSRRLQRAEQLMGRKPDVIIPFDPAVSFEEFIFCGNDFGTALRNSYENVANYITRSNKVDPDTLLVLAEKAVEDGEMDHAESLFRQAISRSIRKSEAIFKYGRFLRSKGDIPAAIHTFEEAIDADRTNASAVVALVATALSSGKSDLAKTTASAYINTSTDLDTLQRVSRAVQGVFPDLARTGLIKVAAIHATAYNCIAVAELFAEAQEFALAAEWYRKSGELWEDNTSDRLIPIYNLGYSLDQIGDPMAAKYLEDAIDLFENNDFSKSLPSFQMNVYQAMSQAYWKTNKRDRALGLIFKALSAAYKEDSRARVFSSLQYKYVPIEKFRDECVVLKNKYETEK